MDINKIKYIIDRENGKGYSNLINLKGYVFTRNNSFIVFELKNIEDVRVCHIKYIYFDNIKDLKTIIVNCANFWMGYKVQFLFLKEKRKPVSAIRFLESLNFRKEVVRNNTWNHDFECNICNAQDKDHCECVLYKLYK